MVELFACCPLALSLISNLGLLFAFKYFNFFAKSIDSILSYCGIALDIPYQGLLLPVGISFYTFQTLSYTIDVYRGTTPAQRHLGIFALYVSFFPQLVAGPIERSSHLLPQFFKRVRYDHARVVMGLKLMLWGFFKKLVIADQLSRIVNTVYAAPEDYYGIQLIVATYLFAIQIFCDFSGYSDIAIGTARVLGFDLMENFRRPYYSKSVAEFWKRWHISLSSWFRDYLYIALGGNRTVKYRWYMNIIVVFLLSGLWHGASWTFVVWGLLHGFYLVTSILTASIRCRVWSLSVHALPFLNRLRRPLSILITFNLVSFAWIFFRAETLKDAMLIIDHIFVKDWMTYSLRSLEKPFQLLVAFSSVGFLELIHFLERKEQVPLILADRPLWQRWTLSYSLILGIIIFGNFGSQEFIYFQF